MLVVNAMSGKDVKKENEKDNFPLSIMNTAVLFLLSQKQFRLCKLVRHKKQQLYSIEDSE